MVSEVISHPVGSSGFCRIGCASSWQLRTGSSAGSAGRVSVVTASVAGSVSGMVSAIAATTCGSDASPAASCDTSAAGVSDAALF